MCIARLAKQYAQPVKPTFLQVFGGERLCRYVCQSVQDTDTDILH